jgi:hypothetical protein
MRRFRSIAGLFLRAAILSATLVFSSTSIAAPLQPIFVESASIRATDLPRDIAMNKDAGHGNELFITVRLDNGKKLPFILDTGASGHTVR